MKFTVLVENTAMGETLAAEHGLSLYIETQTHKILFDMGQSDRFLYNAQQLGIDLSQVDIAILSHGHYDHGGGLSAFLRHNTKAPVYIHKDAFGQHYNGKDKYIGLDPALLAHPRIRLTGGTVEIAEGLLLTDCSACGWSYDSFGLNLKTAEGFIPDPFSHEQYLQITQGQKRIIVSGCSHKGIGNIAKYFHPYALIGGFHLNKQEDPDALLDVAKTLSAYCQFSYTGHCTGDAQYAVLKGCLQDRLQRLSTGAEFTV